MPVEAHGGIGFVAGQSAQFPTWLGRFEQGGAHRVFLDGARAQPNNNKEPPSDES